MSKTTKTKTTRKSAKAEIKAHVAAVRAENGAAHEDRLTGCTKAAESVVITEEGKVLDTAKVTKVPMGKKGVDAKGKRLALTSPKKMGAARKSRSSAETKKAVMKANTRRIGRADWSKLPEAISTEAADRMLEMLQTGEGATGRMVEEETKLGKSDRARVLRVLTAAGWKLSHKPNPAKTKGDPRTANLYSLSAPAAL